MDPRPSESRAASEPRTEATGSLSGHETQPRAGAADAAPFLSPPQRPDELGRLGSYRVLGELGRGGMGVVFRAEETELKRLVALKVMLPQVAADARAKARFRREAEAQAKVDHEHVAVIHRVGEANGVPFIAMPLLKGQTLSAALKQNPRPPLSEVLRVGREVAEGLAAAHEAGLVHRDIKPGNVWLEGNKRRVKILDFGLARAASEQAEGDGEPITSSGAVVGTPAYMSPEQATGQPIDYRSDLFSLGALLYQMATGAMPFTGANAFSTLVAVTEHNPPPPAAVAPGLPDALSELVVRLLAKDPAARPQGAGEVAAELEAIESGLSMRPVQVVPLPSVLLAGAAPDPWAEIDATEPSSAADEGPSRSGERPRAKQAVKRPAARRALWLWAAVGLAALAGTAALAVKFFRPAEPRGVLNVETEEPDWEVVVKQNGQVVRDRTRDREFVLPPGEYTVEPADPRPGVKAFPPRVALAKDGRERVRLLAEKPKQPKPKEPDPTPAADRKAAEALIPYAELSLRMPSGESVTLQPGNKVPAGAFTVFSIAITRKELPADFVEATLLPALAELKSLATLKLWRTARGQITEECVARLAEMPLAGTLGTFSVGEAMELTPRTLDSLKRFPKLEYLDCGAARVDDALLERLGELPALATLQLNHLGDSGAVTERGLATLVRLPAPTVALTDSPAAGAFVRLLPGAGKFRTVGLYGGVADDDLRELARCPTVQTIWLSSGTVTDAGLKHLEAMGDLRVLVVKNMKVTKAGVERLAKALPRCRIEWDGGIIEPTVTPDRLAAESLLPHCALTLKLASGEEVRLKKGGALPEGSFLVTEIYVAKEAPENFVEDVLLPAVARLRELQILSAWNLEGPQFGEGALARLAEMPLAKTIQAFSPAHSMELTPRTLDLLARFPKLSFLACRAALADDELLGRLRELPLTEGLSLRHLGNSGAVTDKGLRALARLPLRQVEIPESPAAGAFVRVMPDVAKFRTVFLSYNVIGDDDIKPLGRCPEIEALSLRATDITDAGLKHLEALVELRSLDVKGTKVTKAGVEKFAKSLPLCKVEWDGGTIEPGKGP